MPARTPPPSTAYTASLSPVLEDEHTHFFGGVEEEDTDSDDDTQARGALIDAWDDNAHRLDTAHRVTLPAHPRALRVRALRVRDDTPADTSTTEAGGAHDTTIVLQEAIAALAASTAALQSAAQHVPPAAPPLPAPPHSHPAPHATTLRPCDALLTAEERSENALHVREITEVRVARLTDIHGVLHTVTPGFIDSYGGQAAHIDCTVHQYLQPDSITLRGGVYDTGCGSSLIDEAAVKRMVDKGIITGDAVITLTRERVLAGFDASNSRTRVTKAVQLSMTFMASGRNQTPARLTWLFLVVPNLGETFLLGNDVIGTRDVNQRVHSDNNITYEFLPARAAHTPVANALKVSERDPVVPVMRMASSSQPLLLVVARTRHLYPGDRRWVKVRVCNPDHTPVIVDPTDTSPPLYRAQLRHPSLPAEWHVTGGDATPLPLCANDFDDAGVSLVAGDIIGAAHLLVAAEPTFDQAPPFTAADIFCGVGGLSYGASKYAHTTLAIDRERRACEIYKLNHPRTDVTCGDVSDLDTQVSFVTAAWNSYIDSLMGGPPCVHFSMAGLRDSIKGMELVNDMLAMGATVPSVRVMLMENVTGLLSTPEYHLICSSAAAVGFAAHTFRVKSDDCALPTRRKRVFILFVRVTEGERSAEDAADWNCVMKTVADILEAERGLAGNTSVRRALGRPPLSPGEQPTAADFYRWNRRNVHSPEIYSLDDACPTLRGTCLCLPHAGTRAPPSARARSADSGKRRWSSWRGRS